MEKDYIYIVLFFFRKKLELVYEAGEMIRDIVADENISEREKLDKILLIIEQCGFAETTYKTDSEKVMQRCEYTRKIFESYSEGEFKVTFRADEVELECMNGSILFEIVLN